MTNHSTLGLIVFFAAALPTLIFAPGVHLNYAKTVLQIRVGLPKLASFPATFGGSGETIDE